LRTTRNCTSSVRKCSKVLAHEELRVEIRELDVVGAQDVAPP
jgi:hypothetical protein